MRYFDVKRWVFPLSIAASRSVAYPKAWIANNVIEYHHAVAGLPDQGGVATSPILTARQENMFAKHADLIEENLQSAKAENRERGATSIDNWSDRAGRCLFSPISP
ncbi:hypothetical protein [uncultured Bradyrhizobium sp.]|uniref:hypothetical protein n=1 Tax=uncultured Bradyrhizobium sp. TaxID=199684 RepID=UPI0035CCA968